MAYHTATLVLHEIWVIGGNNGRNKLCKGIHVLDTKTLQWRTVHVRSVAGPLTTLPLPSLHVKCRACMLVRC